MQTLTEIQALLQQAHTAPNKRHGQCFLIDLNLMDKMLAHAGLSDSETVLEVGPGTGSLTDELIAHAGKVIAVEIDANLVSLLRARFATADNFTLIEGDVLKTKSRISPAVLTAVAPRASLVSNLPYNIATPLIAECLGESWRSLRGEGVQFERLVFTVQHEVAERMAAAGGGKYGIISVLAGILGRVSLGAVVPASAFWPKPKVAGRIVRIDFDTQAAGELHNINTLRAVLAMVFNQRRKRIATTARSRGAPFSRSVFVRALEQVNIDPGYRAEQISPGQYRRLANTLDKTNS